MKPQRRWIASVLAASREPLPALPWARGMRRRPAGQGRPAGDAAPSPKPGPAGALAAR